MWIYWYMGLSSAAVLEILSHSLNQWLGTWWGGRARLGSSGVCNVPEWWKGWGQDPRPPSPHLRAGSEGEGVLLEISVYLRSSKGRQVLSFVFVSTAAAFEHSCLLQPGTSQVHCCFCSFYCVTELQKLSCILKKYSVFVVQQVYAQTQSQHHAQNQELPNQFYHLIPLFFWSSSCWITNLSSLIISVAMILAPGY